MDNWTEILILIKDDLRVYCIVSLLRPHERKIYKFPILFLFTNDIEKMLSSPILKHIKIIFIFSNVNVK